MKSGYFIFTSVLALMLLTAPAFSGQQGAFETSWKIGQYSLLGIPDSDNGYGSLSTSLSLFDHQERETNILLAQVLDVVAAREEIAEEKEEEMTAEQIGELMANPFSYLWFGMIQNDTYWWDGDLLDSLDEDKKVMNTTMFQPVMSMQLTEKWKMIFRPVIPIHSFDTISGFDIITDDQDERIRGNADFDRKTGLGDILLWAAFTNHYKPPFVWGFGPTIMMDTASDELLGTGKWSAGPMGLAAHITDKWIFAGVAQHWWSFAGNSDRDSVNMTDFQPIIRYRLSAQTNIGIAPNIQYNWNGGNGDKLRLPIGGGISTVVMLGRLPLGIAVEYYYYLETPDTFGPKHQIRVAFTPVVPSPDWSRVPFFGK